MYNRIRRPDVAPGCTGTRAHGDPTSFEEIQVTIAVTATVMGAVAMAVRGKKACTHGYTGVYSWLQCTHGYSVLMATVYSWLQFHRMFQYRG